jgi:predicted nucleic acid-binding protein
MNGNKLFIDTNICIYLLNGDTDIANLLDGRHIHISFITEIELYAYYSDNPAANKALDEFSSSVTIIEMDEFIKYKTIKIRKSNKLKIPDAIIAASALSLDMPLISADKGMKRVEELELILYAIAT